jgi:YebC/PmpR family DNA-binding regulatory protein
MAGHSHWANIAHKKAAIDKKRGKLFSKLARRVIAAAKQGGGDPSANLKLANAVAAARAANMSNDQIGRAIQRAVGDTDSGDYEELTYEGYAPGGAAVLIEALTDNRNRTGGDVRSIFTKSGGNLGTSGSVAWQFSRMAVVRVPTEETTEDDLMMLVLDAGADAIEEEGDVFEVRGAPDALDALRAAIEGAGLTAVASDVLYVPSDSCLVDDETGKKVAALLDALEENDDVQNVYSNAEFPEGFEA